MNTIELFMWGYQPHFRISAQSAADGIFSILDRNLCPNVFLVGILVEDRPDRHPICLEPEDCGYRPDMFADVKEQALHLEAVDEERHILHSHPAVQESHTRRLKLKALTNAVQQSVRLQDEYRGVVSFCSWPILVEGYRVIVVLQFNRKAFDAHYALVRDMRDRMSLATSLLDATVSEYLDHCAESLGKPNPGAALRIIDRDYDEIIRAAGKSLMYTPAYAGAEIDGLHGLFEACNTISSLRYEGAETIGRMLVARRGHPNIETMLAFVQPVRMRDYRAVRKLLEMSSDELCLLSDSGYVYGLGNVVGLYDQRVEDLFSIHFTKHYTWEVYHADHLMMRVVYGQPELPRTRIDRHKFESDVQRIFSQVTLKATTYLWELVIEATKQKHGTMVVDGHRTRRPYHANDETGDGD
jgi:hypothetical protein